MSLALGMSKTRPSNLLSAEAEHALSKLTIDKEAAVRCLFMPAGYRRHATATIGGTDDMRGVRVRERPRRGQPGSYRHTVLAEPLGQVAGVFGVQRSGEERADVGRPGVELAGERARIVTVARQRGFEVVNRPRQHLLDDLGRAGLRREAETLLEGECQVHLDLQRGAQALGDTVGRVACSERQCPSAQNKVDTG